MSIFKDKTTIMPEPRWSVHTVQAPSDDPRLADMKMKDDVLRMGAEGVFHTQMEPVRHVERPRKGHAY